MNISQLSFKGNNYGRNNDDLDVPEFMKAPIRPRPSYENPPRTFERTPVSDSFERAGRNVNFDDSDIPMAPYARPSKNTQRTRRNAPDSIYTESTNTTRTHKRTSQKRTKEQRETPYVYNNLKKKSPIPTGVKTFAAGVLATLVVNAGAAELAKPEAVVVVPFDNNPSIVELAENYGSSVEAIYDYNNITEETNLNRVSELSIPSSYDYLQERIEKLQDKLFNDNLSEKKRAELEEQLQQCKDKQAFQQQIATVYTDGKYVYIQLKDYDENTPEDIKKVLIGGVNVERFKDYFDIEDKAIRRHNDISSVWATDNPEYGGYYDFTHHVVQNGATIKVPVDAIKTNDIDFDY